MKQFDVDATLAKMIYNWPTLYQTRLDALLRVFTSSDWARDGTPCLEDTMGDEGGKLEDEDEAVRKNESIGVRQHPSEKAAYEAYVRLRIRKANNESTYVRENASLLAIAYMSKFSSVPNFSSHHLNRIPLDKLTPEWKTALVEFCKELLLYTEKQALDHTRKYAEDYRLQAVNVLAISHETAREALHRVAPELSSKEAEALRNSEIEKLRNAAQKLGLKLVKAE